MGGYAGEENAIFDTTSSPICDFRKMTRASRERIRDDRIVPGSASLQTDARARHFHFHFPGPPATWRAPHVTEQKIPAAFAQSDPKRIQRGAARGRHIQGL